MGQMSGVRCIEGTTLDGDGDGNGDVTGHSTSREGHRKGGLARPPTTVIDD